MLTVAIFSTFMLLAGAPTPTADDPPGGPELPIYYRDGMKPPKL